MPDHLKTKIVKAVSGHQTLENVRFLSGRSYYDDLNKDLQIECAENVASHAHHAVWNKPKAEAIKELERVEQALRDLQLSDAQVAERMDLVRVELLRAHIDDVDVDRVAVDEGEADNSGDATKKRQCGRADGN